MFAVNRCSKIMLSNTTEAIKSSILRGEKEVQSEHLINVKYYFIYFYLNRYFSGLSLL